MLIRELERQGSFLFRWRSYVPLSLVPLGIFALWLNPGYLGDSPLLDLVYEIGCLLVAMTGLLIRGITLGHALPGSSGRNTKEQVADHLNTKGIYSIVRHPLYLGNILMALGVLLFTRSVFLAVAGVLFYLLYYERIVAAEEKFLNDKYGETFREWAGRTPALWPRFSQYEPTGNPTNWRAAIKGEFYGFTATVGTLFLLDVLKHVLIEGHLSVQPFWAVLFGVSLVLFFVLRHLRKHTRVFEPRDYTAPARQ